MFEVHSPNSHQACGDGKNCRPCRQPLVDVVIVQADHREVDLHSRTDGVSNGIDCPIDAVQVVVNIAKIFGGVDHHMRNASTVEFSNGFHQRRHGVLEQDHLFA